MDKFRSFCLSTMILVFLLIGLVQGYNHHYMEEQCDATGLDIYLNEQTSTYGWVHLVRNGGYSPNLQCKMTFWAPVGYRLVTRFLRIEIYKPEKDCTSDVLFLSGNTSTHNYCGTGTPSYSLVSTGRILTLEFKSGNWDMQHERLGFELYYTSFHQGMCDTEGGTEFQCWHDYRCIPAELKCDGLDNCGDWSDERSATCGLPAGTVALITLTCILCCGVCIAAGAYCFVDKKKGRAGHARRATSNNVAPAVEYNPYQAPGFGQAPPPYTSYFTTPAYSEHKEIPPSYCNNTYDNPLPQHDDTPAPTSTGGQETTASPPSASDSTSERSSSASSVGRSSVVTPPAAARPTSPDSQVEDSSA